MCAAVASGIFLAVHSLRRASCVGAAALVATWSATSATPQARAQAAPAEAAAPPTAAASSADAAQALAGETYEIPTGNDPAALLQFVRELVQQQPQGADEQQQMAETRKIARTVARAATAALAGTLNEEQEVEATYFLLQGLDILRQLGDEAAGELQRAAIVAARRSDNRNVASVGMKFAIESSLAQWGTMADDRKEELIGEVLAHLSATALEPNDAQTVMVVADFLGEAGDFELARRLLREALPKFRDHASTEIQGMTPLLEGIARRLELPGKPLQLEGALLGGGALDWKQYQGKVVLIDFWASWCGPCQAELPNVLEMYRAYKDKGFEVIGICLDDEPEPAEAFLKKQQIPWKTLFSDDPQQRGWEDPRAVEYGVTGIPLAILLDREGRVVSMNARGEELGRQLQQLLGEPLAAAPAADATPAAQPPLRQVSSER